MSGTFGQGRLLAVVASFSVLASIRMPDEATKAGRAPRAWCRDSAVRVSIPRFYSLAPVGARRIVTDYAKNRQPAPAHAAGVAPALTPRQRQHPTAASLSVEPVPVWTPDVDPAARSATVSGR